MTQSNIYSIGYGTRTIQVFVRLLKQYNIEFLIDVRSQPYSKFNVVFNKRDLEYYLHGAGIRYVFMGDNLGGRPQDRTCYTEEGRVDYLEVKKREFYKEGIERLKTAYEKGLHIALMCSEINPSQCHRSKLIGASLCEDLVPKIDIKHIDEKGLIKDQEIVMKEVIREQTIAPTLFNDTSHTTSRKSYSKPK
ncbi:MAG: hypothetical protein JWR18_1385 [Segetibacter sp.]|nr:hypothetical protein [Segetibacter sp.]